MTTLDLSKYIENLKKYRFSDSLIIREKESYSKCIEILRKVKFSDFKEYSLYDYIEACCDFGNNFRWTGGMEPVNGIRIKDVQFISINTALVSIEYAWLSFDEDLDTECTYYGDGNKLILIKQDINWYIDKVDSFDEFRCMWERMKIKIEDLDFNE